MSEDDASVDLEKTVLIALSNSANGQYVEYIAQQLGYSSQILSTPAEILAEIDSLEEKRANYKIVLDATLGGGHVDDIRFAVSTRDKLVALGKDLTSVLLAVTQYSEAKAKCERATPGIPCLLGYRNDQDFIQFLG